MFAWFRCPKCLLKAGDVFHMRSEYEQVRQRYEGQGGLGRLLLTSMEFPSCCLEGSGGRIENPFKMASDLELPPSFQAHLSFQYVF